METKDDSRADAGAKTGRREKTGSSSAKPVSRKSTTAAPYRYRGRWRIQVPVGGGKRLTRDFEKHADAKAWAHQVLIESAQGADDAELGGPHLATLADALYAYAHLYTLSKKGAYSEVGKINRYLAGARRPLLSVVKNSLGACELQPASAKKLAKVFAEYRDSRIRQRQQTYEQIARLAVMRCADIKSADIRRLKVAMEKEGLSGSTVQKEIALLKAVFSTAIREWGWNDFKNPCSVIQLAVPKRKFVHLTKDEESALIQAIEECDNPYIAPLVFLARETTLRRGTLLSIRWRDVDIANRCMMLPTKTGQRKYVFTQAVQHVLQQLKNAVSSNPSDDRVFPLSPNALTCAWKRLRERARVPNLQFMDLRHLGATSWVRRGLGTHQLKAVLGHSTIATAQFYVDLVGEDQLDAIDTAMEKVSNLSLPHVAEDAQKSRNLRQAARLNKRHQQPAADAVDAPVAKDVRLDTAAHSALLTAAHESTQHKQISPIAVLPSTSIPVNFTLGNAFPTTYQYSLKSLPSQPRH